MTGDAAGRGRPGVGVGVVVVRGGRLLMVRRAGAHGAGEWSVPGGKIDLWESPGDAAVRETLEETGVVVGDPEPTPPWWTDDRFPGDGLHFVCLWVRCRWVSGEPEVVEPAKCPWVGWVPLAEAAALSPLFGSVPEALAHLTGPAG